MIRLGVLDRTAHYLIADYIEICTIFVAEQGGELAVQDFSNFIGMTDSDFEDPSIALRMEKNDAEIKDFDDGLSQQILGLLEYRYKIFGQDYPFTVEDQILKYKFYDQCFSNIPKKEKVYIFLLLCSRLRTLEDSSLRNRFANKFEELCKFSLSHTLNSFDVFQFGAGSDDRATFFNLEGSGLHGAIKTLSKFCGEKFKEGNLGHYPDSGDNKTDIVGWKSFDDEAYGSFMAFGQCAARENEWPKKKLEANPHSWTSLFDFMHDPLSIFFIPHCYRTLTGEWDNYVNLRGVITYDRKRIFSSISPQAFDSIDLSFMDSLSN